MEFKLTKKSENEQCTFKITLPRLTQQQEVLNGDEDVYQHNITHTPLALAARGHVLPDSQGDDVDKPVDIAPHCCNNHVRYVYYLKWS